MGADRFDVTEPGATAAIAFSEAQSQATYAYGHGGCSGTIAEKRGFTIIQNVPVSQEAAYAIAEGLFNAGDRRAEDKWGPALAIPVCLTAGVSSTEDFVVSFTPEELATAGSVSAVAREKLPARAIKAGHLLVSVSPEVTAVTQKRAKVDAPEGATVTRYIVSGPGSMATSWSTGLPSQAAARAYLSELANTPINMKIISWGQLGAQSWSVTSVSRRSSGAALLTATSNVSKITAKVTVVTERQVAGPATPTHWYFFGYASS